jgi:hypothetical protein
MLLLYLAVIFVLFVLEAYNSISVPLFPCTNLPACRSMEVFFVQSPIGLLFNAYLNIDIFNIESIG